MKLKIFAIAAIMLGLCMSPFGIYAEEEVKVVAAQEQEVSNDKDQAPTTLETIKQYAGISALGGLAAVSALLKEKAIIAVHESGHAAAMLATGNKIKRFNIQYGYVNPLYKRTGFLKAFEYLCGPLAGAAGYLLWSKLWDSSVDLCCDAKNKKLKTVAKVAGYLAAAYSTYGELRYNLVPIQVWDNDGALIQRALATVAPTLSAAYPYLSWAIPAVAVGYYAYRIYQECNGLWREPSAVRETDEECEETAAGVDASIGDTTV